MPAILANLNASYTVQVNILKNAYSVHRHSQILLNVIKIVGKIRLDNNSFIYRQLIIILVFLIVQLIIVEIMIETYVESVLKTIYIQEDMIIISSLVKPIYKIAGLLLKMDSINQL